MGSKSERAMSLKLTLLMLEDEILAKLLNTDCFLYRRGIAYSRNNRIDNRFLALCWATISAFYDLLSSHVMTNKDDDDDSEAHIVALEYNYCNSFLQILQEREITFSTFHFSSESANFYAVVCRRGC